MLAAAFGIGVVVAGSLGAAPEASADDAGAEQTTAAEGEAPAGGATLSPQAQAEVDAARAAAGRGQYDEAVEHFEAALGMHALPQLQYNIAVCYHRATIEAKPDSPAYVANREAAVVAYNRYLEMAPDAADRDAVEANVVALGGRPKSKQGEPWTPELVHPDDVPDPPEFSDPSAPIPAVAPQDDPTVPIALPSATDGASGDTTEDTNTNPGSGGAAGTSGSGAQVTPPRPDGPRVALGGFIPLVFASPADASQSTELSSAPMIGLGIRASGFLGNRRRLNLGGELSLSGQPLSSADRHILTSGWLALAMRYDHPIGDRLRFGGGGIVGATGQTLRYNGADPLRCGARQSGPISQRTGLLLAARATLAALLGRRKRHALTFTLTPGLAAHGVPTASQDEGDASMGIAPCREEPDPFAAFGVRSGASFVVVADFGYSVRL